MGGSEKLSMLCVLSKVKSLIDDYLTSLPSLEYVGNDSRERDFAYTINI